MATAKKANAPEPKKGKCHRCSRTKVGTRHTAFGREMGTRRRTDRLLARSILQPFSFKEKEAHPTYHKGARDLFINTRRELAVKNSDKLLRVAPEEKKDDKIRADVFKCPAVLCDVQFSGDASARVLHRGETHLSLHFGSIAFAFFTRWRQRDSVSALNLR